ncbi:hypothetical protein J5N97_018269 [Dioscorea zingiberensis]|uniref:Uncharacterized protein n=1 Tax=Dioscorea zingiberensis TaxID=325984 RepID=A0A9D5CNH3_9LILI|nr:hypothetical protein J5N97_018269 [Dioscorea zingiberensis]
MAHPPAPRARARSRARPFARRKRPTPTPIRAHVPAQLPSVGPAGAHKCLRFIPPVSSLLIKRRTTDLLLSERDRKVPSEFPFSPLLLFVPNHLAPHLFDPISSSASFF